MTDENADPLPKWARILLELEAQARAGLEESVEKAGADEDEQL